MQRLRYSPVNPICSSRLRPRPSRPVPSRMLHWPASRPVSQPVSQSGHRRRRRATRPTTVGFDLDDGWLAYSWSNPCSPQRRRQHQGSELFYDRRRAWETFRRMTECEDRWACLEIRNICTSNKTDVLPTQTSDAEDRSGGTDARLQPRSSSRASSRKNGPY